MSDDVRIEDRELLRVLAQLASETEDMSDAMRPISETLADSTAEAFATESDPVTGARWPDLSKRTKEQRAKKGYWPGKMLQATGDYAQSFQSHYGPDYALHGTNKKRGGEPFGRVHQFGGKNSSGARIPARPHLGLNEEGIEEVFDIIERHLGWH